VIPSQTASSRPYLLERVDDAAIVQVYADGFPALPREQRVLAWHLYEAARCGRDIYYDQRYRNNLAMRDVLEGILRHPGRVEAATLAEVRRYTKLFWIHTGPYNSLTARKFVLALAPAALRDAAHLAAQDGARFTVAPGETLDALLDRLEPCFFDPAFDPSLTVKTPPPGQDILTASANNLYDGVAMADLDGFTERYGLNSRLVKRDGRLVEEVYRSGGRYGEAIDRITGHLEAAAALAPAPTRRALEALVRFYRTGEDADRRAFDVAWVADHDSAVDTINGFTEVYLDARGVKGAWEAIVFYVNPAKTARVRRIVDAAQWFEDRMPWDPAWRRTQVTGVSARVVDVVVETGDAGPMTPIGINLPNDDAVREEHGSKSVSLANIVEAYEKSQPPEFRREFSWDAAEAARAERWGPLAGELTTDLHEILGHGSGRVEEGRAGTPQAWLREHYSTIEETRADLVALYWIADPQMVALELVGAADHDELVRAEYEAYARQAIVQLRRVREGDQIEEDHMRNRQAIVHWLMANTAAIERRGRDGRSFNVVVDVAAFRAGVARLLAEVQRIKATGDYDAAAALVGAFGTRFDVALRDEVLARVDRLNLPAYTAFVMPELEPLRDEAGRVVDAMVHHPCDFERQMLEWSSASCSEAS
jgi:dipeptidyl-peptidase-3